MENSVCNGAFSLGLRHRHGMRSCTASHVAARDEAVGSVFAPAREGPSKRKAVGPLHGFTFSDRHHAIQGESGLLHKSFRDLNIIIQVL